jgi:hypothetical protein
MTQARGRSQRIGQLLAVENFELSVPGSFQDRVSQSTVIKPLSTAMAKVAINVQEVEVTSCEEFLISAIRPLGSYDVRGALPP